MKLFFVCAIALGISASTIPVGACIQSDGSLSAKLETLKANARKRDEADSKALSAAKTEAEREEILERIVERAQRERYDDAAKALSFVKVQPTDPEAVNALTWILQTYPGSTAAGQAVDLIINSHISDSRVQGDLGQFTFGPLYWAEKLLRSAANANLTPEARRAARFHLATHLMSRVTVKPTLIGMEPKMRRAIGMNFGEQHVKSLESSDTSKAEQEALGLFEEIAKSTSNDDFTERAKSAIYELKYLAVGRPAPEIVGEDIDGKQMKLSDFRGKVVMLDFWGHW